MRRRQVLAAVGGTGVGSLAGCLAGRFGDDCPPRSDTETPPEGWAMPGFGPGNTAVDPGTGLGLQSAADSSSEREPAAIERWRFDAWEHVDDEVEGSASAPVVDDDRVYLAYGLPDGWAGSTDGSAMIALDESTGTLDWQYTFATDVSGEPVLVGDGVLVGTSDGTLARFDREDGTLEWETDLGAAVRMPTVADGWCYVQCDDGRVYAVDTASGDRCWDARPGGIRERLAEPLGFGDEYAIRGRPAVTDDAVVVTTGTEDRSTTGTVQALERVSGEERWTLELEDWASRPPRSPVIADGTIYVAAAERLRAIGLADGDLEWTFATGYTTSAPAVDDEGVYCSAKNVYAIDRDSGTERWRHVNLAAEDSSLHSSDRVPLTSQPAVVGDLVAVGFGVLDRSSGEHLWGDIGGETESEYFHRGFPRPQGTMAGRAIANDALYASTIEGRLAKVRP